MRRFFGYLLILIGLAGIAAFLYVAFQGKYGMNQFISAIQDGRFDPKALVVGVPAAAVSLWGCSLAFRKKGKKKKKK
jgi:hypothetical protein